MTLHQIQVFIAVAEALSVSKASTRLHISQPAVTHQVKSLEDEFQAEFYKTNGRGIELTTAGQRFLDHARSVTTKVKELDDVFDRKAAVKSQKLNVGACYHAAASVFPSVLASFKKAQPETEIAFVTDVSSTLQPLVSGSKIDIGVILDPTYDTELIYEPLWQETPVIAGHRDHLLTKRKSLTLGALAEVFLIIQNNRSPGGLTDQILKSLQQTGTAPKIALECSSDAAVRAAVRSGLGLGVFFYDFIEPDLATGALRILDVPALKDFSTQFYAVYQKEKRLSGQEEEFLEHLRTAVR